MKNLFENLSKIFYTLAIMSIFSSIYIYQLDNILGIYIGLWVPTLLLLGPSCPWAKE